MAAQCRRQSSRVRLVVALVSFIVVAVAVSSFACYLIMTRILDNLARAFASPILPLRN
jgi:hypothetical protein